MKSISSTRQLHLSGENILRRMEMWCARHWIEARNAGLTALAANDSAAYTKHRHDEQDWFGALLVVNRLNLGIEPLDGKTFLPCGDVAATHEILMRAAEELPYKI